MKTFKLFQSVFLFLVAGCICSCVEVGHKLGLGTNKKGKESFKIALQLKNKDKQESLPRSGDIIDGVYELIEKNNGVDRDQDSERWLAKDNKNYNSLVFIKFYYFPQDEGKTNGGSNSGGKRKTMIRNRDKQEELVISDCRESKIIQERAKRENQVFFNISACITSQELQNPKAEAMPIFNIYSLPVGKSFHQLCKEQLCYYLIQNMIKGVLSGLRVLNKERPSYLWGNLHEKNIYYDDSSKKVFLDNLINNYKDKGSSTSSLSSDFMDFAQMLVRILKNSKTDSDDGEFFAKILSTNDLYRKIKEQREDPLAEQELLKQNVYLGIRVSVDKPPDSGLEDLLKPSIFNFIARLVGKKANPNAEEKQFLSAEEALQHAFLAKEIEILSSPSDLS